MSKQCYIFTKRFKDLALMNEISIDHIVVTSHEGHYYFGVIALLNPLIKADVMSLL